MRSAGALVQTHPMIASSVVISKSRSIGQMSPPEKLGSRWSSTVPQTHPGRVLSCSTQVRPLRLFSRERSPLTRPIGGPGQSGIDGIISASFGLTLNNLTGGYYDIVSWDPRGVGRTT